MGGPGPDQPRPARSRQSGWRAGDGRPRPGSPGRRPLPPRHRSNSAHLNRPPYSPGDPGQEDVEARSEETEKENQSCGGGEQGGGGTGQQQPANLDLSVKSLLQQNNCPASPPQLHLLSTSLLPPSSAPLNLLVTNIPYLNIPLDQQKLD